MAHTSIQGGRKPLEAREVHGLGRSGLWVARVEALGPAGTGIGPNAWLAGPHGTRVRITPAGNTGYKYTFTASDPDRLAGRDAATHVNAFLADTGLSVKGTQYRHESDGPVLRVRDGNDVLVATVFLREALGAFGGAFDLTTVNGAWTGAALNLTGTLAGRKSGSGSSTASATRPFVNPGRPAPRHVGTGTTSATGSPSASASGPTIVITPAAAPSAPSVAPALVATKSKTSLGAKVPKGYAVLVGRKGKELVIPQRVIETWHATVLCRFDDGEPAHPLAIGPTGTGKTEGVIALALSEGIEPLPIVQCGGIIEASDLFGTTQPDETGANGWKRFPSVLWSNLRHAEVNPDKRFCIILDEVNRMASTSAMNSLFGLMDGTAELQNPATGESVALPANVIIVSTANIGAVYRGVVAFDAATTSRYWTNLVFGYLPEPTEASLFESFGLDATASRLLARASAELRKADTVEPFRSALVPGTRELVAVAKQARHDPAGVLGAFHDKVTCNFSNEVRGDPSKTEYARVRVIEQGVFAAASSGNPQP